MGMSTATCIYALAGLAFGIALVGAAVGFWRDAGEWERRYREADD
jgi:hypothetical protein